MINYAKAFQSDIIFDYLVAFPNVRGKENS